MIEVKLSVEEYNRLFRFYLYRGFDDIFCKVQNDSIIFVDDRESDDAIASISLNTPEGKILSNYTECQLRISINDDEDIFIHETCMNPDDPYIGHCYNCNVDYCRYSYDCEKGMKRKIDELDKNINDIKFINPISGRSYEKTKELNIWQFIIGDYIKKFTDNADDDAKNLCETAHLLQNQIQLLYSKWKYTEGSANKNQEI